MKKLITILLITIGINCYSQVLTGENGNVLVSGSTVSGTTPSQVATQINDSLKNHTYIESESDPIYIATPAFGISANDTSNYREAYDSLHNHANKGLLDAIDASDTTRWAQNISPLTAQNIGDSVSLVFLDSIYVTNYIVDTLGMVNDTAIMYFVKRGDGKAYEAWCQFTDAGAGSGTVTSITPGNGFSDNTPITTSGTITLGTPGEVNSSTTNAVTTNSHTHALAVNLADAEVTGNLPVSRLNSGTSASSSTFWRGDGIMFRVLHQKEI